MPASRFFKPSFSLPVMCKKETSYTKEANHETLIVINVTGEVLRRNRFYMQL